MNKIVNLTKFIILSMIATSCSYDPPKYKPMANDQPAIAAIVGQEPKNYEQTIREYLRQNLKDPNSMIDFSIIEKPIKTSCKAFGVSRLDKILNPYKTQHIEFSGWRVTVSYNAKNSYGGYVGLTKEFYWFHGEKLIGASEGPYEGSCDEAIDWFWPGKN